MQTIRGDLLQLALDGKFDVIVEIIASIIEDELAGEDHMLVEYAA